MTTHQFRTEIEGDAGRALVRLPFDPHAVWGAKDRHHVRGSVNGCPVRGPLDSDGQGHFLALGAAWRRDNGLGAGDPVEVELSAEGPQVSQLAPDLQAALEAEPQALAFFQGLATFYRKAYLTWIDGTRRRPEVRAERIAEMVLRLKAGEKARR